MTIILILPVYVKDMGTQISTKMKLNKFANVNATFIFQLWKSFLVGINLERRVLRKHSFCGEMVMEDAIPTLPPSA